MKEPRQTMTAVKTKTVTRTQMAVALACLGASMIAAAAMSIAAGNASTVCFSKAKINVALTLGQEELVSACGGQLIVPTPKFSQLLVRSYNDNTLTLLVDKKYVTFKVGEGYKPVGKPVGDIPGYQQNLYVEYGGKVDKKADIVLYYGVPKGEKGVYCSDNDESQKNYDGSSIKDFQFINPYVKGTASYYDEESDEMIPVEDSCMVYDYGYYGAEAADIKNNLQEGYCSTADGGKWFSKIITCEGGCVDGACVYVAPPKVGTMNVVSGGKLETTKLKAGENEVAKLSFTAIDEDVLVNQLVFTFDPAGQFKPEQIQGVVLKDSVGGLIGGPQLVEKNGNKYQAIFFKPNMFLISATSTEPQNYSLYATVNDPTLLSDPVSGFRVSIDPQKDVTAVGVKTQSSIKPINKKGISWQTMYGVAPKTDSTLSVIISPPYSDDKLFTPEQEVDLAKVLINNVGKSSVRLKTIKFTQTILDQTYASPADFSKLWLVDKYGNKWSEDIIPLSQSVDVALKFDGFLFGSNQAESFVLKGVVNQIGDGAATSGHGLRYKVADITDIKGVYVDNEGAAKVELKKADGSVTNDQWPLVYVFESYPAVSKLSVENTKLTNGMRDLYKFQVAAVNDDISLYKFSFLMSWIGNVSVGDLYLYDVTNSVNEILLNNKPGVKQNSTPGNAVWSTTGDLWKENFSDSEITVAKNQPRVFVLRGKISGATANSLISTKLLGSGALFGQVSSKQLTTMGTASEVNGLLGFNSFIWSDRNSATHSIYSKDWTTGHDIIGLPLVGTKSEILTY